ncbi:MAG: DNA repair protein RecO [Clostridia bacterium]|nr:DNA repair protein RecO [Clostridia bacterium]
MAICDKTADALVIRELPSGDHDKILTLLTADEGRITVIAKGARSLKSRVMPACRAFVWGNYEIHRKGEISWLRDASVTEPFVNIGTDLQKLYLAQYLADLCYDLSGEEMPAGDLLRLMLNTLHALDRGIRDEKTVKAVFELRAAALSGYMPELDICGRCGKATAEAWYLDVMNGCTVCSSCVAAAPKPTMPDGSTPLPDQVVTDPYGTRSILLPLPTAVLAAMRYVLDAPQARMLSFELKDAADTDALSVICETYILNHLGRGFSSLKLYREILKM